MRKIPLLIESAIEFPEADQALEEPNGLLAAGGSLSKETLLSAYKNGIFPGLKTILQSSGGLPIQDAYYDLSHFRQAKV